MTELAEQRCLLPSCHPAIHSPELSSATAENAGHPSVSEVKGSPGGTGMRAWHGPTTRGEEGGPYSQLGPEEEEEEEKEGTRLDRFSVQGRPLHSFSQSLLLQAQPLCNNAHSKS